MENNRNSFDWKLVLYAVALQVIGFIAVFSTSQSIFTSEVFHHALINKNLLIMAFSSLAFIIGSLINYKKYQKMASWIFALAILLLLITLNLPGSSVKRWIQFGSVSFQTAEFAKLAFIIFLAKVLSGHEWDLTNLKNVLLLSPIALIPFILIFQQPDLGTAATFVVLFFIILFWSGLHIELILLLFSPLIGIFLVLMFFENYLIIGSLYSLIMFFILIRRKNLKEAIIFLSINSLVFFFFPMLWQSIKPYQQQRVLAFINPALDPRGIGIRYHTSKSIIAIASGGLIGQGILKGPLTHLHYIPEQHTDFIFSVIGEEAGFLGSFLVVILFCLLLFRILQSIERSYVDDFGNLLSVGIFGLFIFQIATNIFMALGLFPVVGIPLPLMSYGGSSTLLFWFMLGIIQSINLNSYKEKYQEL